MSLLIGVAMLTGIGFAYAQGPAKNPRLAFVIGNAGYAAGPLATAANDAGLIAEVLATNGFDVTAIADANSETLGKAARAFIAKAQAAGGPSTEIVVYVSGYGLQTGGENVVVPVDAPNVRDIDVAANAFRLSDLTGPLQAVPAKARLFIFNLARATPFPPTGDALASGLMPIEVEANSLVAINTAPGTIAPTDIGIYGVYARILTDMLRTPGLTFDGIFEKLRLRVAQVTNGAMIPWDETKLSPDVGLLPSPNGQPAVPDAAVDRPLGGLSPDIALYLTLARDTPESYDAFLAAFSSDSLAPRIRTLAAARRESLIWAACVKANDPACYWTYMRRYPRGPHLYDAKQKLAALNTALEPPPRFEIWNFGSLGVPASDELTVLSRHPLTTAPADAPTLPSPPQGLLPPARSLSTEAAFAPLAVPGALPIAMPLTVAATARSGSISENFVPGFDDLVTTFRDAPVTMVVSKATSIVVRTEISVEQGNRVITQRDADGAIVSRSMTSQNRNAITTLFTGPGGGVLGRSVTTFGADGGRATTLLNGNNQLIAAIDHDKNGVQSEMKVGPVPVRDQRMVFKPAQGPKGSPSLSPAPIAAARDLPPPPPPAPPKAPMPIPAPWAPAPKPDAGPAPSAPEPAPESAAPEPAAPPAPVAPPSKPDEATAPSAAPDASDTAAPTLPAVAPTPPPRPHEVRIPGHARAHAAATPRRGSPRPRIVHPRGRRR